MNIAFLVNQTHKEKVDYTTTGLALEAHRLGHKVYYIGVGDLAYFANGQIGAHARVVPQKEFRSTSTMLEALRESEKQRISAKELDVLLLRNDPVMDMESRPWAQDAGILFGQLASQQGVVVLNDPNGLAHASSKLYLQYFPAKVRPDTIITRNLVDVEKFYHDHKRKIILKPLKGSGGKNVFLVDGKEDKNMKQIVEAICRDGFLIAQEYLPEARKGDIRLFLLDGDVLQVGGKIAAIRRVQKTGDIRSNIHQGGQAQKVKVTKQLLDVAGAVAQKLKEDGMFLAGLDVVGNKLMEINVFSPGGLQVASELYGVDFCNAVMTTVEQRVGG
ncbi:glutathione synthase [Parapedobacter tibetensis]|uniref:glutathione synthase n=1 Tax=Parapedobacter tibetensis TaxID=2972951 RepID=UPI00214D5476|nr:glutathione synthase [Parapedobacter tibetensis]